MTALTCRAARRRLQAFHDEELSIAEQISVAAHLEACDRCASDLAELRALRTGLRGVSLRRVVSLEEGFQSGVVTRLKAERSASFPVRALALLDDKRMVYAGLGAALASAACVLIVLGMMHFATRERPDSLAAIVNLLASPGSNLNPVPIDPSVLLPRALDESFSASRTGMGGEDAVYALSALVTREGRVENLELLHALGQPSHAGEAKLIEHLLDTVGRARLEPAKIAGAPVAVNMVWLVARTTVRAKGSPDQTGVRPVRKRTATATVDRPVTS
jgi:hypothetical protein